MNKELLNQAIKCLQIRDVIPEAIDLRVSDNYEPAFPEHDNLVLQYRHGIKRLNTKTYDNNGKEINVLIAHYECALRILPPVNNDAIKDSEINSEHDHNIEHNNEDVLIELIAVFAAYYEVNADIQKESIEEFGKYNVGYHVWPYWREFASSMLARVRIPIVSLPLYTIPE